MMPHIRQIILILVLAPLFYMPAAVAMEIEGRVTKVIAGDTIWVKSDGRHYKIKMRHITSPESTQEHSNEARSNLRSIINGKKVLVRWIEYDRLGRALGQVIYRDEDMNLRQIRDGHAKHDKTYPGKQQDAHDYYFYDRAEEEASLAHRGLWQDAETFPATSTKRNDNSVLWRTWSSSRRT